MGCTWPADGNKQKEEGDTVSNALFMRTSFLSSISAFHQRMVSILPLRCGSSTIVKEYTLHSSTFHFVFNQVRRDTVTVSVKALAVYEPAAPNHSQWYCKAFSIT